MSLGKMPGVKAQAMPESGHVGVEPGAHHDEYPYYSLSIFGTLPCLHYMYLRRKTMCHYRSQKPSVVSPLFESYSVTESLRLLGAGLLFAGLGAGGAEVLHSAMYLPTEAAHAR